ncbi:MAG: hypothetical protein KGH64_04195 [Candidatus Micrarchaeota archaeon]|nr:hypothetical protein [Candidatus Micrarchaeota archaeon]MDE1834512.1 hypothetical protein [Candidatus Micrarchaeota archaeon]MDE1859288.1 hypothetical protein [Candidatus Micrarchaeota archaeon]
MNGYERASNEIVPAMRLVIARELKVRYNMTESRIAQILGVAQAAISKYLNENYSERIKNTSENVDMVVVNKFIENIAKGDSVALKRCICTSCSIMNEFDCSFSSAEK